MRKLRLILIICLVILIIAGCDTIPTANIKAAENAPPAPQPAEEKKEDEYFVISAVGDIMMHNSQVQAGYRLSSGDYDFSSFFTYVKPLLLASDLVIGNLETTFAGKEAGFSGYPRFNTPDELAADLKDAGFHIVTTANNHCLDKGQKGLFRTLDCLDAAGLLHTGTARSQEEQESILMVERKGVHTAILSYTYGTNGLLPQKDQEFSVNYLAPDKILTDIKKARDMGAHLVIIALHHGIEYQLQANAEQEQIAQLLLAGGADIILGHHPHVIQPVSIIAAEDGNQEKNKIVCYSLGNFVSDQVGLERVSSIILNLFCVIDSQTKQVYFKKATYIPIRTRRFWQDGRVNFEILPVEAALTSISTGRKHLSNKDINDLKDSFSHVTKHLQTNDSLFTLQPLPIPLEHLDMIKIWR